MIDKCRNLMCSEDPGIEGKAVISEATLSSWEDNSVGGSQSCFTL